MSEFTDGVLVLRSAVSPLYPSLADLPHPYIVKHLNERWSVITFEDSNPTHEPVQSWLLGASRHTPLLAFHNAEDHGWGYSLFHGGEAKATLDVNYHIAEGLMLELAEKTHPGVDVYGELSFDEIERLNAQVQASEAYKQEIANQYTHPGAEHFAVFGLSADEIAQLRDLLQASRYEGREDGYQQVDAFQHLLGIEEMSWISYHYLSQDQNAGDFDE